MEFKQTVRQDQRLIMSAAMERAFHILMMPSAELSEWLESEIESNPLLKLSKPREELPQVDLMHRQTTLYEHLTHQIELTFQQPEEKAFARILAGSLDEKGFHSLSSEELKGREEVVAQFQHLDPLGIGARNAREALLIQLEEKKGSPAYLILSSHYEDLLQHRWIKIAKKLKISLSELQNIIHRDLRPLNPFPASGFQQTINPLLTPDLAIHYEEEIWSIEVIDSHLPTIEIDNDYMHMLQSSERNKEENDFIRRHLAAGNWLQRSIDRRHSTLHQIGSYLLKKQKGFLEGLDPSPQPMTMKEMATALNLNESTITRAISNKTVSTPRGLIPLRKFFTHPVKSRRGQISNDEAKRLLIQLINQETLPLSDEALAVKLKAYGIECARRTVAKYRKELKIGSVLERRAKKIIHSQQ
ncbi:MAG: RNA polymerase factor sigma-54 [Chlamydiales bacterium]|nr:RNA polymerase factor sigma-54 [Chlamydiales bacterium]